MKHTLGGCRALLLARAGPPFINYGVAQNSNSNKLTSVVSRGYACLQLTVRYAAITLLRCPGGYKIVLTSVAGFSANKLRAKTDVTDVARILSNKSRDIK